ncbi:MAG: hypothetical protein ACFFB5_20265 [Promethearchaeota archaeon]
MTESGAQEATSAQQELFPIIIESRRGLTLILIFIIILAIEVFGFFLIRSVVAQSVGEQIIIIDVPSVIVLIIGAFTLTYLYYTHYVKRVITLGQDSFSLKVGKRLYEYKWNEFSFVALSVATSAAGIKGFTIRIYQTDLEGDYVELPIYRFTKSVDVFDLRNQIEEKIRNTQAQLVKNKP